MVQLKQEHPFEVWIIQQFQFLNGSIKANISSLSRGTNLSRFNSSMVQLKPDRAINSKIK